MMTKKTRKPMKRAITIEFTWIFILLAGGVIITFFLTLAYRENSRSEQKVSFDIESHLDDLITTATQSPGVSFPLPTPPQGVAFSCSNTCDCRLSVGSQARGTPFGENIIFAHHLLTDEDLTFWTLPVKIPFRVTNIIYITNPLVRYYFVTDSGTHALALKDKISRILPKNISAEFIDISRVPEITRPKIGDAKFIFLDSGKSTLHESFEDVTVDGLEIHGNTIQFLFKDESRLAFSPLGKAAPILYDDTTVLLAAAISDTNMFSCGLAQIYSKTALVSRVMAERAVALDGHDGRCFYAGPAGQTPFEDMATHATSLRNDITSDVDVGSITRLQDTLDQLNKEHIRDGCPELY